MQHLTIGKRVRHLDLVIVPFSLAENIKNTSSISQVIINGPSAAAAAAAAAAAVAVAGNGAPKKGHPVQHITLGKGVCHLDLVIVPFSLAHQQISNIHFFLECIFQYIKNKNTPI